MKVALAMLGVLALVLALAYAPTLNHRWTDENYDGTCEIERTPADDQKLKFDAVCTLWPTLLTIEADSPITGFSREISTERDALLFGGGGPACRQVDAKVVQCDGEVDAGEKFSGWIETVADPCEGVVTLQASGGGCSDIARNCDDIGVVDDLSFPRPDGCSS